MLNVVPCTCVYSIYVIVFQDQLFKVLGIQSRIWCTLAWYTAIFVNFITARVGPVPNEGERGWRPSARGLSSSSERGRWFQR